VRAKANALARPSRPARHASAAPGRAVSEGTFSLRQTETTSPPRNRTLPHTLLGLLAAIVGGLLFNWLNIPLAYILGAMTGSALYANAVAPLSGTRHIRRAGQLVIGSAVAAILTPAVVADLARLFPYMLAVAAGLNLAGGVLAFPVARIAGVDRLTALLSCLPAGMAEMATLARELKAQEHVVALIHTLRVILVVSILPLLVGVTGAAASRYAAPLGLPALGILALFIAVSIALAWLAGRIGLLNAWIVAPMTLGLVLAVFGVSLPPMPGLLVIIAQLAIGASLGSRFRIQQLRALPRATVAGLLSALVFIALAPIALASLMQAVLALDYATLALSLTPGGMGEMIASAKALGIASATVAGFQFVRTAMTNLLVPLLIRGWVTRRAAPD
jgi:membrane AbrB-like protein